jgi:hypothetical protein
LKRDRQHLRAFDEDEYRGEGGGRGLKRSFQGVGGNIGGDVSYEQMMDDECNLL